MSSRSVRSAIVPGGRACDNVHKIRSWRSRCQDRIVVALRIVGVAQLTIPPVPSHGGLDRSLRHRAVTRRVRLLLVGASLLLHTVSLNAAQQSGSPRPSGEQAASVSPVWIEYAVTGDAELEAREEDVVMCSETEDGFKAHTLGDWVFTLEADGNGPGQHAVSFTVAASDTITALRDDNYRTDHRFYGEGTMTIEAAGKDDFGFALITAEFTGVDLQSEKEHTISVKGKLGCQVL